MFCIAEGTAQLVVIIWGFVTMSNILTLHLVIWCTLNQYVTVTLLESMCGKHIGKKQQKAKNKKLLTESGILVFLLSQYKTQILQECNTLWKYCTFMRLVRGTGWEKKPPLREQLNHKICIYSLDCWFQHPCWDSQSEVGNTTYTET